MKIRTRLTLQFLSLMLLVSVISFSVIYISSSSYRKEEFYSRLESKARNTANLLIQVEEINAELLLKIEEDNPMSLPNETVKILDYNNNVVFSTDINNTIEYDDDILKRVRLERRVRLKQGDYEIIGILYADRYDRFVVFTSAVDIYGFKKLKNLRTIIFIVTGGITVILVFFGWFLAGRAIRPISRIISEVEEINFPDISKRLETGLNQDEINQLASTFNSMLNRLEQGFHVQRDFITNVSHELRTPLTVITSQLEVLLMRKRTPERYVQSVKSTLNDIKYLNNLLNRLLLLAQTNSQVTRSQFSHFRIDETLWQARDNLLRKNTEYQIHITLDSKIDDESFLTVYGDEALIRTAFINLIDNGCKYSPDQRTEVELVIKDNKLNAIFSDKGIGIPQEEQERIFSPFIRGSNAHHIQGIGIGLSLVSSIITIHQAVISLVSNPGEGTAITIIFPPSPSVS